MDRLNPIGKARLLPELQKLTRSQLDALQGYRFGVSGSREHKYVGGPPPKRIRRMQYAHETRARRAGVAYNLVDLRAVYEHWNGCCGICGQSVGYDEFQIDHIRPISIGGPHVFENLQPAHRACNSRKGDYYVA